MANSAITPIIIKHNDQFKKLCYLSFNRDGSIYISFPRKRGYIISQHKDVDFSAMIGCNKIKLEKNSQVSINPYLSYHPSMNSIHINLQPNGRYRADNKVLDLSATSGIIAFPFCQIVFPDFQYLDMYNHKNKHSSPLEIVSSYGSIGKSLSLEFFVHPIGTYFEAEDLPLHKIRAGKYVGLSRFESPKLTKFTITVVMTELAKDNAEESIEGIIAVVYGNDASCILQMDPL